MQSGVAWPAVTAIVVQLGLWYAAMTSSQAATFAELFDTGVRYTGMSLVSRASGRPA